MLKNALIMVLACATTVLAVMAFRADAPTRAAGDHPPMVESVATSFAPAVTPVATPAVVAGSPAEAELTRLQAENERLTAEIGNLKSEVSYLNARRTPAPSVTQGGQGMPQVSQRILSGLLGKPETVGLAMDWIKADQSRRFASLIALAGLEPAREAELRDLLAERYASRLDVAAAGVAGVAVDQRQQMDADFRARLEGLVGADVAALFEKAEGKPVSFERMQRLEDRLRYDAQPLTREQYLPLWNLISSQVAWVTAPRTEADLQKLLNHRIDASATIAVEAEKLLDANQLRVLRALLQDDVALARVQTYAAVQALRARVEREAAQAAAAGGAPRP